MIVLRAEQEKALYSLLEGNDILAVLPTGFGKIHDFYDVFCCCSRTRTPEAVSVLAILPLNRIITDQIAEAAELTADKLMGLGHVILGNFSTDQIVIE